jgi:osmotically-inducible protein OsmY
MSDSTLRQDVLDELEFEPSTDANNVGVTAKGGVVTVSGHVSSYAEMLAVEHAVQRRCVKAIAEEIKVRFANKPGTSDDEIARRAIETMKWSTLVPDGHVQIVVQNGHVTLTGSLDWNYQRAGTESAVAGIAGVVGVTNDITLRPRVSERDAKLSIERALARNAAVEGQRVHAKASGDKVTLEGSVETWAERRIVEQATWSAPGVTAVDCHVLVGS